VYYTGSLADAAAFEDAPWNDEIYCQHGPTWTGKVHCILLE